jgi:glycosyltransferase involved in cell wall biosynthesis
MKVLLVGNYESDRQESMQRFANMLNIGLSKAGHDVKVLRATPFVGRLKTATHGVGKWCGYIDKFICFPVELRRAAKWADIVHICDHSNAVYTRHLTSRPHVVTCHDLLAVSSALNEIPGNRTSWTGQQFQKMILGGLVKAQHVICVSEATRTELIRLTGLPRHRVSLIYNGIDYPYASLLNSDEIMRKREVDNRPPLFLHVGGNQWYKNRLGVLEIFSHLVNRMASREMKLIMVGKPWTREMRQFVSLKGLRDKVIELTNITDQDLRTLYLKATALLFPSLREGFGWPIVEAQACGCPVFTSNRVPMTEVGGNAAIYVDPTNVASAAAAIADSLHRVPDLRQAGLENAKRFCSATMISAYSSLYQRQAV